MPRATKTVVTKKSVPVESTPASAPVVEATAPVVAPASVKRTRTTKVVEPVEAPVPAPVVEEVVAPAEEAGEEGEVVRRTRPRNRAFPEVFDDLRGKIKVAYDNLQAVHRGFSALNAAHSREVHTRVHRESANRTPTTLFDKPLCDYLLARLSPADLRIVRKSGDSQVEVDLSSLSPSTPVFRTDLTKLYTIAFRNRQLTGNGSDKRIINYSADPELVRLLTTGNYKADLEEQVQQIRDGTYELTIFKIQRFLNHHLSKAESVTAEATA